MDEEVKKKITDPKRAQAKAEHYCAYQERSQQEVRDKLYEWGVYPSVIEQIITRLIGDNFLNEERFAMAYAQGKFNQKQWGRVKIKQGLKLKRVSDKLINKALRSLDGDAYMATLEKLMQKKADKLTEREPYKRRYKLQQYAMSRGFESDLISEVLKASALA
ncbi:regulatory protein RecX [Mucilaginibacter koreensis]